MLDIIMMVIVLNHTGCRHNLTYYGECLHISKTNLILGELKQSILLFTSLKWHKNQYFNTQ